MNTNQSIHKQAGLLCRSLILVQLACGMAACGDGQAVNEDQSDSSQRNSAPAINYVGNADFQVSESWLEAENGGYALTTTTQCTKNSATGTFEAKFTSEGQSLAIRLRNFSSSAKSYSCLQAANNNSAGSVGDRFHGCGVEFSVDADDGLGANTYASYRNSTAVPPFQYAGDCKIEVTRAQVDFRASLSCIRMAQTHYDGEIRNPADSEAVASVSATVSCEIIDE